MSSRADGRRPRRTALLLPVLLTVTACAGASEDDDDRDRVRAAPSAPPSAAASAATELTVEGTADEGAPPVRATLTCGPPGGDHPDPAAACADLEGARDPFAPLSAAVACTEQYGGPQTALVSGTHRGQPVRLELSRTNGCSIAQWDRLGAVLSALVPVGA